MFFKAPKDNYLEGIHRNFLQVQTSLIVYFQKKFWHLFSQVPGVSACVVEVCQSGQISCHRFHNGMVSLQCGSADESAMCPCGQTSVCKSHTGMASRQCVSGRESADNHDGQTV